MHTRDNYDAVIVGSGPNGMAAAVELSRNGKSVLVIEGRDTLGGGTRTQQLTLPGFQHDVCSSVHPLGIGSPWFRAVPLQDYGLEWVIPPLGMAHPFDDGSAAVLSQDLQRTKESLGQDGMAYLKLMEPLVRDWQEILEEFLGPLPFPPKHPIVMARFGLTALRSARGLVESRFQGERARAFFSGMAGHAIQPMENPITASFGLMLGALGHVLGWPFARGGSKMITAALEAYLKDLGGETETGWFVGDLDELPDARAMLFDTTPGMMVKIVKERFPERYRKQLRKFRHGPGIYKVDWALNGAVPWKAEECRQAGVVHIGGTFEEIAASERAAWEGRHSERPFVLFVQPTLFDPSRAPDGKHIGWGYCHVPAGSDVDMLDVIEGQIERFAPGFRDCILERKVWSPRELEAYNPNYIGGDIASGIQDIWQLFTRPVWKLSPYETPLKKIYLCSASTPPGGGVHGMGGYHAARAALRRSF